MTICSVVSSSAMVLTYKMSRTTSNTTKMCSKCTNFIKTIKATKQFVVFLFVHSWEQRKLGDFAIKVTEKNTQNTVRETFTNSAEFGVVSQRDFFDHDISKADKIDGYYVVENDDFIYNPRISVTAPCGPINRNKLGRKGVMSPLYTVFRIDNIDALFLEWFFKSSCWYAYMYFNGDSGARSDRFSIKNELFFDMPIPTPNIDEQKRIGMLMDSLSDLITLHQCKCLDKLHALSILPCPLPSRKMTSFWEQRKLGEVATITKGQQINKTKLGSNGTYYVLNGGMTPSGYTDSFNTEQGTISISEGGNSCGYVNYNYEPFWSGGHNYTLLSPKICTDYLYQMLKYIEPSIMALRVGSGLPNIQKSRLNEVNIVFPSKEEQRLIGDFFTDLDNLITLHQRQLEKLKNIKSALLEKMFV